MKKIPVCSVDECKALGRKVVAIEEEEEILVLYSDGEFYAVSNICPHAKTKLLGGKVENGTITCSNHGICFDMNSGTICIDRIEEELLEMLDVDNLPFDNLKLYTIHIENDMLVVEI